MLLHERRKEREKKMRSMVQKGKWEVVWVRGFMRSENIHIQY